MDAVETRNTNIVTCYTPKSLLHLKLLFFVETEDNRLSATNITLFNLCFVCFNNTCRNDVYKYK